MIRWFEHKQIYKPGRQLAATGRELGRPLEDVWLKTPDGLRLHGWFFKIATAELFAYDPETRQFSPLVSED